MADQIADPKHLQQMLRDAGYYSGPIDGKIGSDTQAALRQYNAAKSAADAEASRAAQARSSAETAKANAEAEKAKADAEKTRAEAAKAKAEADAKAQTDKDAAESAKRIFDTAVTATAYAAGIAAGAATSKQIDKKLVEGLDNKNRELRSLASKVTPLVKTVDTAGTSKKAATLVERTISKIDAIVATADKIGLTKVGRGPAGPVAAIGALAIGAVSRTAAQHTDNETIQTVLNATGTAEMVAGATVGVKDLASRAVPTKTVDAKALSTIEQGRNLVKTAQGVEAAAAEVAPLATRVLKAAGKIALPLTVGMAVIQAARGYAKDGVRGAARGVIDSVDPTSIMPGMDGKGLAERIFDRFAGSPDMAKVSQIRTSAGKEAASREQSREATPLAMESPAVTPHPVAVAADQSQHVSHGWTDAARHASQVSRGVKVTVSGAR